MAAGKFNDIIEAKATYKREFSLYRRYYGKDDPANVPVDLSLVSIDNILCGIKRRITDADPLIRFNVTMVDPVNGKIAIGLTPAQTSLLNFDSAPWDLFVVWKVGDVEKFLEGNMTLSKAAS